MLGGVTGMVPGLGGVLGGDKPLPGPIVGNPQPPIVNDYPTSGTSPVSPPVKDYSPVKEPVKEPIKEPVKKPVKEPVKEYPGSGSSPTIPPISPPTIPYTPHGMYLKFPSSKCLVHTTQGSFHEVKY